jgi:signal peptidase I
MDFDFAAILVTASFLTGLVWGVDALVFAPKRRLALAEGGEPPPEVKPGSGRRPGEPLIVEYARSFFPVILIVLLIRSFLAEPFRIPTSSMVPTLKVGDLILVNKFSYGIRLPVLHTKIVELGEPQRGDVVVFRFPENPAQDYIKRVIGVPGDVIEYRDKTVFLNGKPVATDIVGPYNGTDGEKKLRGQILAMEYLPDREHEILLNPQRFNPSFKGAKWTVEDGHYFVLGDNRDNSRDSRFWGYVPEDHLVGKAFLIWMHLSPSGWDRIGTSIN